MRAFRSRAPEGDLCPSRSVSLPTVGNLPRETRRLATLFEIAAYLQKNGGPSPNDMDHLARLMDDSRALIRRENAVLELGAALGVAVGVDAT